MKPISVLGPSGPKKRPFQSLRWAHRRRLQQHPAELVLPSILLEAQRCGHLVDRKHNGAAVGHATLKKLIQKTKLYEMRL